VLGDTKIIGEVTTARPLGMQFAGDVILGGVDIFSRSVGIGT
jgi:hypothetical protein